MLCFRGLPLRGDGAFFLHLPDGGFALDGLPDALSGAPSKLPETSEGPRLAFSTGDTVGGEKKALQNSTPKKLGSQSKKVALI